MDAWRCQINKQNRPPRNVHIESPNLCPNVYRPMFVSTAVESASSIDVCTRLTHTYTNDTHSISLLYLCCIRTNIYIYIFAWCSYGFMICITKRIALHHACAFSEWWTWIIWICNGGYSDIAWKCHVLLSAFCGEYAGALSLLLSTHASKRRQLLAKKYHSNRTLTHHIILHHAHCTLHKIQTHLQRKQTNEIYCILSNGF